MVRKSIKEQMHHLLMLDGLKWRFQMQERSILVWEELVNHEVLSTEGIIRRIELDAAVISDLVYVLSNALHLFKYAQDLSDSARYSIKKFPQDTMRGLRQRFTPQHIKI